MRDEVGSTDDILRMDILTGQVARKYDFMVMKARWAKIYATNVIVVRMAIGYESSKRLTSHRWESSRSGFSPRLIFAELQEQHGRPADNRSFARSLKDGKVSLVFMIGAAKVPSLPDDLPRLFLAVSLTRIIDGRQAPASWVSTGGGSRFIWPGSECSEPPALRAPFVRWAYSDNRHSPPANTFHDR